MKKDKIKKKEIWGLNHHLAKHILPRLRLFRDNKLTSYPATMTYDEWILILSKMVRAFEIFVTDEWINDIGDKDVTLKLNNEYDEGMALFGKHFHELWD
jgi:hypothetical protein